MTIAELFVKLGVKGEGESKKAISGVKESLGDVKTMSLEAKAAILGVIYGLQRMMSDSMKTGQGLQNFATMTGLSAEQLQRWQYAARQAGQDNEDVTNSFKSMQDQIASMKLGQGAPGALAMLMDNVGFDENKIDDIFYMMGKLQDFAQKMPEDIGNKLLKSFGLTDGMIIAMRKNAFNATNFKNAPIYTDKEAAQLAKMGVAWDNLGNKIKMAMGHLNAKHGGQLIKDISSIADQVLKVIDNLLILAEKLKVFEYIGMIFKGWYEILKLLNEQIEEFKKNNDDPNDKKAPGQKSMGAVLLDSVFPGASGMGDHWKKVEAEWADNEKRVLEGVMSGKIKPNHNSGNTINNTVNQNLNFQHEGKNAKEVGDASKKSIREAFRQMPLNQGT